MKAAMLRNDDRGTRNARSVTQVTRWLDDLAKGRSGGRLQVRPKRQSSAACANVRAVPFLADGAPYDFLPETFPPGITAVAVGWLDDGPRRSLAPVGQRAV